MLVVAAATVLSSAGFFLPLSTSISRSRGFASPFALTEAISRPAEFASPFALAESFPAGALTSKQPVLPAVPLHIELSAASVASIVRVAHEFATAAADLGVMLSHSAQGATAMRLTVWG